jgi:uncharacterized protein YndB with AHSA1/START domain
MTRAKTRTIRLQVFVHGTLKKVFEALSQPQRLTRWIVDGATLSPRKGGRYAYTWKDGPTHTGNVMEFVRGRRIVLTWHWPGQEHLGTTRLKMSVEPREGGTVVKFIHSGFRTKGRWGDLYDGAIRGWTYFMMNLKSVLENGHDLRSPYNW